MNTNHNEKLQPLNDDNLEKISGGMGGPLLGNFINVLGGSSEVKSDNSIKKADNSVSSGNVPKNIV